MNAAVPQHPLDLAEIRTTASSIRTTSIQAIAELNTLIDQKGLNSNLAAQIRDVYADFQTLADDLAISADTIGLPRRP